MLFNKKRIKKSVLKEIDIDLVSMLFDGVKPANDKGFVVKSGDRSYSLQGVVTKFKKDAKGKVYVTLLEPGTKDLQGDIVSKQEVEAACDRFARKGMLRKNDVNHNMEAVDDVYIAENYILKQEDKEFFPNIKAGAWVQVLKFKTDSDLWKKVEKGDFGGVSVWGSAVHEEENEVNLRKMQEMIKSLTEKMEKAESPAEVKELKAKLEEAIKLLGEIAGKMTDGDDGGKSGEEQASKEDVEKMVDEMKKGLEALNKGISKSIKGETGGEMETDVVVKMAGEEVKVFAGRSEVYKAFADLDKGEKLNILGDENGQLFIDEVLEAKDDDTLRDITLTRLQKDNKLDVGLVSDIIFVNSEDGTPSGQVIAEKDLTCEVGTLLASYTLSQDTMEFYRDKYGEEAFGAYVESKIKQKVLLGIKKLLFRGDRASSVDTLKALDGIVKKATANADVTDISKTTYATWNKRFLEVMKSFDEDVLDDLSGFRLYVSAHDMLDIRDELSNRQTQYGDSLIMQGGKVYYSGVEVKSRNIADGNIVAGLGKFIIVGFRTDATINTEYVKNEWKARWNVRVIPGITYIADKVKVFNLVD